MTPSAESDRPTPLLEARTVIIGGGLAGLALADHLERAGAEFILLEARGRLGGRILSRVVNGAGFDLGPTWFWPFQSRMAGLMRRFALGVFDQFATGGIVAEDDDGRIIRNGAIASMAGSSRLDGGLGRLVDALANEVAPARIHLGVKVTSLTRGPQHLLIGAERGGRPVEIRAEQVVLALPPRLAERSIAWDPGLPAAVRRALTSTPTWMAGQAKVLAVYDRPYWRDAGWSGSAMSRRGPLAEIHDASPPHGGPFALFGFVGTPPALRAGAQEGLLHAATDQLARLFGGSMRHPLHLELQDWAGEELTTTPADRASLGRHPEPGRPPVLDGLWEGRIHFAGSEVADQFPGFLEGALEAAEYIAERL